MPPQQIQAATPMLVIILKTKYSCQVIKITSTLVMVSQPQQVQQIPDIAEQLTGQEPEAHITTTPMALANIITAFIGLVLLTAMSPTTRGMSAAMATSTTATSATRATVCAPAFQSRSRSSLSNNQKSQSVIQNEKD